MTTEEKETFYDEEIAPALFDLATKCQQKGLSLLAAVEYVPGAYGETAAMEPDASISMRMIRWASQANGNLDALVFAAQRWTDEENGGVHGSAVLKLLETPTHTSER